MQQPMRAIPSVTRATILFAHGSRDPEWTRPLERLRDALLAQAPGMAVDLAFLELMQPDLSGAVEGLLARGVNTIDVVPVFMAQGKHLKRDLPLLIEEVRGRHPQLAITLSMALGEAQPVIDAMARHIIADAK